MDNFISITVKVLRYGDEFSVFCKQTNTLNEFKQYCRKFSKIPLQDFSIICCGRTIDQNPVIRDTIIATTKSVYLFVKTLKDKYKELTPEQIYKEMMLRKIEAKQAQVLHSHRVEGEMDFEEDLSNQYGNESGSEGELHEYSSRDLIQSAFYHVISGTKTRRRVMLVQFSN